MQQLTPFAAELRKNIRDYIRQAKRDGVVSMGLDCLKQCVKTPSPDLTGAPMGGNMQWQYAQLFRQVAAEFQSFIQN